MYGGKLYENTRNRPLSVNSFKTTYQRHFEDQHELKDQIPEQKIWRHYNQTKINYKPYEEKFTTRTKTPLMQWGGGIHHRNNFNKTRDELGGWIHNYFSY